MDTKLYIGGRWVPGGPAREVRNKYDGALLGTVPEARAEDVEAALASAHGAARELARLPVHRRAAILNAVAALLEERKEPLARTIAAESGKALKFARAEVERAAWVFRLGAEEARRIHGETVALDAVPYAEGYFGFWQRRPIGVVAAITPFNFPLNLVAHKVAPALAAGCPLVLKPAEQTPLTAVLLAQILEEALVPAGAFQLLQGLGETVGDALVRDARVAKISFTGSREVGALITARAGIKKVTLELGNATPVVIAADADLDFAARRCALGAYYNAGQVCISVQRIYGVGEAAGAFQERMARAAQELKVGDPLREETDVGPMIDVKEAERAEAWVAEARGAGARLLAGGRREGALYWPTLLAGARPGMKVVDREVFAPVASLIACGSFEEALAQANASAYALQAAVFTRDIGRVLSAIRELDFGGVVINDSPAFRADQMPYGGNRQSGLGREGLRFAVEEMTQIQMVVIRSA